MITTLIADDEPDVLALLRLILKDADGLVVAAEAHDGALTNLRWVTIDLHRAGLTCGAVLQLKTDGPVDVTLAGCGKTLHFG